MKPAEVVPDVQIAPKQHKRLFVILCVVFAAWMGVLAFLYARTVYPLRYPAGGNQGIKSPGIQELNQ